MKSMKKYLTTGLLALLPISLTLYLIYSFISFFDNLLGVPLARLIGFQIPGVGLVSAFFLVLGVGFLSSHIVGKHIVHSISLLFRRLPLFNKVYPPLHDIIQTFLGNQDGTRSFSKVVWLPFPSESSKSIGFITKENITMNGEIHCAVFIPTTPNPTNGFLVFRKAADLQVLDMTVEQGLNLVISMSTVPKGPLVLQPKDDVVQPFTP